MVEIIPKQRVQYPLGFHPVFYGGVALFATVLVLFFILNQLTSLRHKELQTLEAVLAEKMPASEQELEQKVLQTKKEVDDFARIIELRRDAGKLFDFLGVYIHPEIVFTKLDFKPQEGKVLFSGEGKDFFALAQQLLVLEKLKALEQVQVSNIGLGTEGQVMFDLTLQFRSYVLQ